MRATSRGATLIEVMTSLVVAGVFGGTLSAVSVRLAEEQKAAVGRQHDLDGLYRAARLLESDLRAGLDPTGAGWSLRQDELRRGQDVVARSVGAFEAKREGDLWRVRLVMRPRAAEGARRTCVLDWAVRVRATGGPR
jgi:hypothetical protein